MDTSSPSFFHVYLKHAVRSVGKSQEIWIGLNAQIYADDVTLLGGNSVMPKENILTDFMVVRFGNSRMTSNDYASSC
jgi:hypothetical protein